MEVGPLARWVVGYAQNKAEFKDPIDKLLKDLGLPLTAVFSMLGRTAARALEAQMGRRPDEIFLRQADRHHQGTAIPSTANVEKWKPESWPKEAKGVGLTEAPRGALAHWIKIKDAQDRQLSVRRAHNLERQPRAIPRAISAPSRHR